MSDNKNFQIFFKGKKLEIDKEDESIESIRVSNSQEDILFTYQLEDKKASITITNNNSLKVGNNKITVTVTAEDDSYDTYSMNVFREYPKEEEKEVFKEDVSTKDNDSSNTFYKVIGGGAMALLSGSGVYLYQKKKKKSL